MQKLLSQTFSENIWRILPDANTDSNLWVIELRDILQKQVSFAMLDVGEDRILWHIYPEEADWWTSLTAFSHEHVYLHSYRFPEVPEPTDLLIFSAKTGAVEEIIPNHILIKTLNQNTIEVATKLAEGFRHSQYDVDLRQFKTEAENILGDENQIILKEPVRYIAGNIYFEKLRTFIQNKTGGHIANSIDYLETRPYLIFSYYIYQQDKTVQYLLIVTDQMETVLLEKLSDEREGIGRSTMILKASTLVYLKNNNEFSSLTLSL